MNKKISLLDKIEYFIDHPEDEEYFLSMFTAEERGILYVIQDFEQKRYIMRIGEINNSDRSRVMEEVFRSMEQEREISFLLKKRMDAHIDFLLKQEKIDAWMEILMWYRFLDGKGIIVNRFWEYPILGTMLNAFMEEIKLYYGKGNFMSILKIHSMEELLDTYFRIVFWLRRIEYDVEPVNEVLCELTEREISFTVVKAVLNDARISHREEVQKIIEDWEADMNG